VQEATEIEPLVDAQYVARLLDVSQDWVWKAVRAGTLPAYRFGPRKLRFRESEILAWIEEQAHKP